MGYPLSYLIDKKYKYKYQSYVEAFADMDIA